MILIIYWVYLSSDHILKCITRCDKCYYRVRQVLLQSATSVITKCDKCYYKVRQVLLQSTTSVITKCDIGIKKCNRREVTAVMLVFHPNQSCVVGVEFLSYVNAFFCSKKFAEMLAKWVETLYRTPEERTNFPFLETEFLVKDQNTVMPDGVLLGILGGKGRPVSKSWPYFRPKNVIFHTRFQTRPLKSIPFSDLAFRQK